jgi:hypothetical protein
MVGEASALEAASRHVAGDRIGTRCTGPEEVVWERRGQRGEHLHVAW